MDKQTAVLVGAFSKMYSQLDKEKIKDTVDEIGIDEFIKRCSRYAAASGAVNGFGGFTSMIVGIPVDVVNNVFQQFRVTLAVIYHKKGVYKVSFTDFMKIVGVSVGVEVGASMTKAVLINIANKILLRLSASATGKAVPVLGALICGGVNYGFIKFIGVAVKKIDIEKIAFEDDQVQSPESAQPNVQDTDRKRTWQSLFTSTTANQWNILAARIQYGIAAGDFSPTNEIL